MNNMKLTKLILALNVIALFGVIALSGCGEDDEPNPTDEVTLSADAGADQTVDLGDDVTLNGAASSSSDGSTFNFFWEITNAPTSSTAILSNSTTAAPTFTPDEPGTYTITLVISNLNTEDTDEVTVTVNDVTQAIEIGGVIDSDRVLNDIFTDPSVPDYIASSNVDVRAQLTIDPGVVIYFAEDVVLDIESGTGTLIAEGTASKGIVMTSDNIGGDIHWKGIYIGSASSLNSLKYVEVSYAGNSEHNFSGTNYPAAVGVEYTGKVSVTNSTIKNNIGYGLYADDGGGQIETFADNVFESNDTGVGVPADEVDALDGNTTFSNNADAQVEIFSTTYADTKTSTWPALNGSSSYRVSGNLSIDGDLTIAPGAIFEMDEDVIISVYGSLSAIGTDTEHITFTSSNITGNLYWKGIYVNSASSLNEFTYVDLSYAGNSVMNFSGSDFAAGIGVEYTGKISVNNSTITDNKDYGIYVDDGGGQIENFSANHFENNIVGIGLPADEADAMDSNTTFSNNTDAEVEIQGTNLADTKTVTWSDLNGSAAYRLSGDMDINGDLTIAPGVIMEMDENVQIRVFGALIADGTASDPITFTSSNITGGLLWQGIFVLSTDSRNKIDNGVVAYAGSEEHNFSGSNYIANIGIDDGKVMTVTNSTISNGGGYGIAVGAGASFTESGNTFTNNVSLDIFYE